MLYRLLADAVLVVHAGFIAFVVVGLVLILIGGALGWRWVRSPWFRGAHLLAIVYVVVQQWLGVVCPLTVWEGALRRAAGSAGYPAQGFVAYWLHELIFFRAQPWVFTVSYTTFGLLVAASLVIVPIRRRSV